MLRDTRPADHAGGSRVSTDIAFGRHFSAAELAKIWKLNETTIRRIFQDEPGVFKIGKSDRRKRDYVTLRIPEAVALRVYAERSK